MAEITGTELGETITGTDSADTIYGLAGNDKIGSGLGNDIVYGGEGNDAINGAAGDDKLYGGLGNDTLTGDAGNDELFGEDGNDGFYGGGGNDTIWGGIGNDVVFGDGGNDTIDGGANNDKLNGGIGDDTLSGGAGTDILNGDAGNDTLIYRAGDGSDTLNGGLGIDTISLELTAADMTPAMTVEFVAYNNWAKDQLASVGGNINTLAAQTAGATFTFASLGLTLGAEQISIKVDSVATALGLIINEGPVAAASASMTTDEDTTLSGTISASDPNGDTLSYAVASGVSHGSISVNSSTGAFEYTPDANYNGSDSFTVTITDQWNASVSQVVSVGVNAVNDGPTTSATASLTTDEDVAVSGQTVGADIDGDVLTYSVSIGPANGSVSINSATGEYTFTPADNYNGADSFVVTVTDTSGATATQTISAGIAAVNDAPLTDATSSVSTNEDNAVSGSVVASDVDGDVLSFSVSTGAAHGSVSINASTGEYTYTPTGDYNGADSFIVTISDTFGAFVTQTVDVSVAAVNDAPVTAASASISISEDNSASGTVSGADIDGDVLTYSVATGPAHGSVSINSATGEYTYTPTDHFSGSDTFDVAVNDPSGATANQTVSVSISAVADAPSLSAADVTVSASVNLTGTTGNDNLMGGSGDDIITGGNGNDVLNGAGPRNITAALGISAALADTDGSESITSIMISGLGASSTLSAGTKNVDGSWLLTAAQLSGLSVTTPDSADLTLTIVATSAELTGGSASTTVTQHVNFLRGTNADALDGGAGNDTLTGGSGNNTLTGGSGNDIVNGGAGNDTFIAGLGNDTYNGGTGSDTINMSAATTATTVDLLLGYATGLGTDVLTNFENVIGSAFNDKITGSNSNGYFDGGKGDDDIRGGGGNDTVIGGEGNDSLRGGSGNDWLSGGLGNDTIRGENGDDIMTADAGNDGYIGGSGIDTVDYTASTAAIVVNTKSGTITGWGNDTIDSAVEKIVGSAFADTFTGRSNTADTFDGGAGNDWFRGRTGSDTYTGGLGNDTFVWLTSDFSGSSGSDTITDFALGDALDLTSLTAAFPGSPVSSVITVTDGVDGTTVSGKVGSKTYTVVLLDDVHGVTLASMLADGMILA